MATGLDKNAVPVTPGPYMNTYPADIILLHIGTNDILATDTLVTEINDILEAIDTYEIASGDDVMVFLARTIARAGDECGSGLGVMTYNDSIDALYAARKAAGDSIILVDMECGAGLDYDTDLMDEVHPNQTGYDKMADLWFTAIDSFLTLQATKYELTMATAGGPGTVVPFEGVHSYVDGTVVPVSATPGTGYHFVNWTGNLSGSANPTSITMDADKSVTANFAINQYTLTVNTDGTTGAIVDPSGDETVDHGVLTNIQVVITPTGSVFDGWEHVSGNPVTFTDASASSTTVKLEAGDATIRATFRPTTHTLSISTVGTGTVTKNPNQATYDYNTSVTLTAVDGTGYHFDHWTGNLSGSANPTSITMDADKSVTANFAINQYTLTVNTDGTTGAIVDPSGDETVDHGVLTNIQVVTTPTGSVFDGWEHVSGNPVTFTDASASSTTVKLEAGDATIRATFRPTTHTLSISTVGTGTVTKNPNQATYDYNTSVTLTAVDGTGYHFDHWSGNLSGSANPTPITMDADKSVTANFAINQYTLTVNTDGTIGAIVDPSGDETVDHGVLTNIQVVTTPTGSVFDGWEYVSGNPVTFTDASASSTTVKLEAGDATIRATFRPTTHTLSISTVGTGTVTKNPNQATYDYNTPVQLIPNPGANYHFDHWSVDLTGSANPGTIVMNGDKSVTATFLIDQYTLTVNTDGTIGAIVDPSGDETVDHGVLTNIQVVTTPDGECI